MNLHRHHRNQGASLNNAARSAKAPSHRPATAPRLPALLRAKGTGAPSLRLLAPLALAIAALLALFDGRRRPRASKHQSDGGGQQLVTPTGLNPTAHRHVLGRPDSSTIGTPCVRALLGPALAVPALGGSESPSPAVTATATGLREKRGGSCANALATQTIRSGLRPGANGRVSATPRFLAGAAA
jgi:hypothetical protein